MSTISWEQLVRSVDQTEDEDIDVYEFSNGRKFKNTDTTDSGIYE